MNQQEHPFHKASVSPEAALASASTEEGKSPARRTSKMRILTRTLSLLLLLGVIALTTWVIIENSKDAVGDRIEYPEAAAFFEKTGLSMAGLSEEEVKTVYRDILSKSFTATETASVLNEMSLRVNQTALAATDPATLKSFWLQSYPMDSTTAASAVSPWRIPSTGRERFFHVRDVGVDEVTGNPLQELYCTESGEELWALPLSYKKALPYILNVKETDDGYLLYGETKTVSSSDPHYALVLMVSENGELLWDYFCDREYTEISAVYAEDDVITCFGRERHGSGSELSREALFLQFDRQGNLLRERKSPEDIRPTYISEVIKTDTGYILSMDTSLVFFSLDGERTHAVQFTDAQSDTLYHLTQILYHDGQLWISARIYRPHTEKENLRLTKLSQEFRQEISGTTQRGSEKELSEYSELRKKYFASACLRCDKDGKLISEYVVPATNTGDGLLELDSHGDIRWEVTMIDRIGPESSGSGRVYTICDLTRQEYFFSPDGTMLCRNVLAERPNFSYMLQ